MRPIFLSQVFTVRKSSRACRLTILVLYLIPTNWVSLALLLIESTRSTTHGWVSTKTSRNSLKSLKRIFFQPIWLKGLSIGTWRSPIMSAISRSPFQTLRLPFILITLHWPFTVVKQKRTRQFVKRYCNNIDVKLDFSSFKIGNMFGVKDPMPCGLCTFVVYGRAVTLTMLAKPLGIYPHA